MRIKICGITNVADARLAAGLGADAIGLNFYRQSRRCVAAEEARAVFRELPPFVEAVALFVNLPLVEAFAQAERLGPFATVQWHGDEHEPPPPSLIRLIPAFNVRDRDGLTGITRYLDVCRGLGRMPAAVLVDAHVPGEYGGTGRVAPWELLADYRPEVPLILAGGLTPENVAEAIRAVRPYAVDVASGVEHCPGRKDPEKVRRFIANARETAAAMRK